MLRRMVLTDDPNRGLFCNKLRRTHSGRLEPQGVSVRYSIIAWIGMEAVAAQGAAGEGLYRAGLARLLARLQQEPESFSLGDLGLLLWLEALPGRRTVLETITRQWQRRRRTTDTTGLAWLLAGLVTAEGEEELMAEVLEDILAAYHRRTGLFSLDRPRLSLSWRDRYRAVLGSFASQSYAVMALAKYLSLSSSPRVEQIVRTCAGRMCELQGPAGEYWWMFDVRNGKVAVDYPVYSVHQDAMGPLALLVAMRAVPGTSYWETIERGLDHLLQYREPLSGLGFLDPVERVIWRAVVRDAPGEDPADLPFGLDPEAMRRAKSLAWPSLLRKPPVPLQDRFRILAECRPYCPGWILLAYSQACRLRGMPPETAGDVSSEASGATFRSFPWRSVACEN